MPLTERQKQRAKYHLEYEQLSTPTSLSLGLAVITQAKLVIDANLLYVEASAEPDIIATIDRLDCNERRRDQLEGTMASGVMATGGTKFDFETAHFLLAENYLKYQRTLATQLAAWINPVSNQEIARSGSVIEGDC